MGGGPDSHLLDSPRPDLVREVTGLEPDRSGIHAMLEALGVQSTQRLAFADVGGDVVVLTWPAELQPQAKYLYTGDRARQLLSAAREGGWQVDTRPHLAFWLSRPEQRLYMHATIGPEEYVKRWSGPDLARIGAHDRRTIRDGLWRWLLERGYPSPDDESELDLFLERLEKRKRDAIFGRPSDSSVDGSARM